MSQILVHIVPAMESRGPCEFSMHDQHDAEYIISRLEEKYGIGWLEDPQGFTVLSHPRQTLGAGEHLYILGGPGKIHNIKLQTPGSALASPQRLCGVAVPCII